MNATTYYILPTGTGWRVSSRGFTWDFRSEQEATAFALASARDYSNSAGRPTSVRIQRDWGNFVELRTYEATARRRPALPLLPRPQLR